MRRILDAAGYAFGALCVAGVCWLAVRYGVAP